MKEPFDLLRFSLCCSPRRCLGGCHGKRLTKANVAEVTDGMSRKAGGVDPRPADFRRQHESLDHEKGRPTSTSRATRRSRSSSPTTRWRRRKARSTISRQLWQATLTQRSGRTGAANGRGDRPLSGRSQTQRRAAVAPSLAGTFRLHQRRRRATGSRASSSSSRSTSSSWSRSIRCFGRRRPGGNTFRVCRTLSCAMAGAYPLMEKLAGPAEDRSRHQGAGMHNPVSVSDDGEYSIEFVECLASCGTAPVCMVDDELHENVARRRIPPAADVSSTIANPTLVDVASVTPHPLEQSA